MQSSFSDEDLVYHLSGHVGSIPTYRNDQGALIPGVRTDITRPCPASNQDDQGDIPFRSRTSLLDGILSRASRVTTGQLMPSPDTVMKRTSRRGARRWWRQPPLAISLPRTTIKQSSSWAPPTRHRVNTTQRRMNCSPGRLLLHHPHSVGTSPGALA